ncbi:PIN domain-containing protein [Arthrobacter sp. NPDC057013]|uniref:PIN domain-containing protein n=1 Tax=Arthrobacter sp. NPDC057013 TaxID=3345999 RepID=UPI00363CAD7F
MQIAPLTPDPIIVITDTTELHNSYPLADTRWVLLAKEISAGVVQWVVPEVVVRETVRHQTAAWERAQKETLPGIQRAERGLKQIGIRVSVDTDTLTEATKIAADYESYLRARIAEIGGEVAALPTIEHERLLAWDLANRKPFRTEGKGYRDALIWATVLEYVTAAGADNCVIFVSNNKSDFVDKGGIHADLLGDTAQLQSAAELRHSPGLTAAFTLARELRSVEPGPEPAEPTVNLEQILLTALDGQCSELTGSDFEERTQDGDVYGPDWVPSEVQNPSVYLLEPDAASMTWDVVETFAEGTQLINVTADAALTVDGYMEKGDFYRTEWNFEDDIYALTADHNDHYAWVATDGYARITFSILLSPGDGAVNHTELVSFETGASTLS